MSCPICRSPSAKFLFFGYDLLYKVVVEKFSVYRCATCHALFLSPFPSQEETKKFYPTTYYSYDTCQTSGFFERLKEKIIRSRMEKSFRLRPIDRMLVAVFKEKFGGLPLDREVPGTFLDIGCGTGKNVQLLSRYGWDAYGIELDAQAVQHAKALGLKVERASLDMAVFPGDHFDCIRIWHVFEHLTDPHGALQKMKDLLSDGGEILMALPNGDSFARLLFGKYWYNLDVPRHVINYTPKTLRFLAKKHGLRITELKYSSCGWFIGSLSNFLHQKFGYRGNLINNIWLVILFSPLDVISDLFRGGDVIFLKLRKVSL